MTTATRNRSWVPDTPLGSLLEEHVLLAFSHRPRSRSLSNMSSEDPTKRYRAVASILLVSDQSHQVDACQSCAQRLGVYFKHCGIDRASEAVVQWRPFAVVVDEAVYRQAETTVENIARQAKASVVVLTGDLGGSEPSDLLMPKLRALFDQHFA